VHDAARAIQFLRSKAGEWNFKERSGLRRAEDRRARGTSLWLNYHDDLADPKNSDPVLRESTRLCAAVGHSGDRPRIDPKQIVDWVGRRCSITNDLQGGWGANSGAEAGGEAVAQYADLYREFSAYNHVDKNDPPALLIYGKASPLPAPDAGTAIHHAAFGRSLKEKADAEGAVVLLRIAGAAETSTADPNEFLLKQLKR
jgi:hypothetical protein